MSYFCVYFNAMLYFSLKDIYIYIITMYIFVCISYISCFVCIWVLPCCISVELEPAPAPHVTRRPPHRRGDREQRHDDDHRGDPAHPDDHPAVLQVRRHRADQHLRVDRLHPHPVHRPPQRHRPPALHQLLDGVGCGARRYHGDGRRRRPRPVRSLADRAGDTGPQRRAVVSTVTQERASGVGGGGVGWGSVCDEVLLSW